MAEFTMPSLGADMEAGKLVEWLKRPGDEVKRGDIIAEVETDKGIIEIEVFHDGLVQELLVQPGTKVPVGTPLAIIRQAGESAETSAAASPATVEAAPHAGSPGSTPDTTGEARRRPTAREIPAVRPIASPAARRLARDLGVDLSRIRGTGPRGAVSLEDVQQAAGEAGSPGEPAPDSGGATPDAKGRMRQAIAAAMARSKREIPHYYVGTTIDVTNALGWLEAHNADVPVTDRLLPALLFLRAVAIALRDFPELNGTYENNRFEPASSIHVGAAIALRGGGLVAPALRDTDSLPLGELMHRFRDLVSRARKGALRSSEFSGGTITVTSLGDRGTETVYGVIYPPQVAIVGFGKVLERPWVAGGKIVPRHVVSATLSADHRTSDGHRGALFLDAVDQLLQTPDKLT